MSAAAGPAALPATMKAFGVEACGPVENLKELTLPVPTATGHDLLVQVKAVSMNPVDTKKRAGAALGGAPSGALVMGYDASGVVIAVGDAVTLFKPGDEVFYAGAVQRAGTNAEYHVVDERIVGRKPSNLTHAQAAAVPLVFLTAWEAMVESMCIAPGSGAGKTILIVGGAGGVGSIATQIAKHVLGLTVVATASRTETVEYCKTHGADHVIDHRHPLAEGLAAIGIPAVDYAFCTVDLDCHFDALTDVVKPLGRIAGITLKDASKISVFKLFAKRLTLSMELMFTRALFNTPDLVEQHNILTKAADLLEAGTVKSTVTSDVPLTVENLRKAHEAQASGTMIGKQVLSW